MVKQILTLKLNKVPPSFVAAILFHRAKHPSILLARCTPQTHFVYLFFIKTISHFIQVQSFSFFWENHFFSILGSPKKLFWPLKTLFGLRNLTFGGVILLKLFDPSIGFGDFQGWLCPKRAILTSVAPKPLLGSKSFRGMTPPKSEVSKAK